MMQEFVIGMQPIGQTLTPNSKLLELILITERTRKISLFGSNVGGDEVLTGIEFDDGTIDLRVRENSEGANITKQSISPDTPFVDSIVFQQTCYSATDKPHLYWRRITYIKIESKGKTAEIGVLRDTEKSVTGSYVILPVEKVDDPCMISGVGYHNGDIVCLQIIAAPYMDASSIPKHLYAHGKSKVGLLALKDDKMLKLVEDNHLIGMEDDRTYGVINNFYNFATNWYSSRASINRMYPAFYELIDSSISNKDRNIIFSVLRMERNLRWRINAKFDSSGHNFDSDPFLRLKVHQVVKCLATTMDSCQRILVGKPRMNCYAIAYLSDDVGDYMIATLVLITQISMIFLLLLSIIHDDKENSSFLLTESILFTPIIAIFSSMLVYKQISNIGALWRAYPGMHTTPMGVFDILANGILGIAVLIIQVLIVMKQQERLDFVLNSIATMFVLQLDDNAVFVDDNGITDLNRRMLMKIFDKGIRKIDEKYFKFGDWKTARNKCEIDPEECDLIYLPDVNFDNDEKSAVLDSSAQPIHIGIEGEEVYEDASDGWLEIASSGPITYSKLEQDSKAELSFKWRDQGYGNRKGKLRVRLVSVKSGEDVATSPEYGLAPHQYEVVSETFDCNHGMVRFCAEGYKYVVEVCVGGGGHQIYVESLKFEQLTAFTMPSHDNDESV